MNNLVFLSKKGNPVTNSRLVAEMFEKLHKNVLRDIENLECSNEFRRLNFALSSYTQQMPNNATKQVPEYIMTRDGFTFLAMGFTGKKAAQFKEAYIAAFNAMEAELKQQQKAVPQTYKAALLELVAAEEEKERLQLQNAELAPKAEFYDDYMSSDKAVTIGECAKILSKRCKEKIGQNKLFDLLRKHHIFMKGNDRNIPYQSYIDMGLFEVVITPVFIKKHNETRHFPTTHVLPKGIDYIHKVLSML
jgi:anti-repressor protein